MIKQENLLKKIGLILEELNEQYLYIAQHPDEINQFELELFYANATFLTDHLEIIKKITNNQAQPTPTESESHPPETVEESAIAAEAEDFAAELAIEEAPTTVEFDMATQPATEREEAPSPFEFILEEEAETDKFEFEEKQVDELFNRPFTEEEQQVLAQKRRFLEEELADDAQEIEEVGPEPFLVYQKEEVTTSAPVNHAAPTITPQPPQTTPFENPKVTLNDILASQRTANSLHAAAPVISDLRQGINLNDKLLFIKDLFNGFNLAYAEAIDLANKLPNFEAAAAFFQNNYAGKNNWAAKQQTVDQFYEILNRRFNQQG